MVSTLRFANFIGPTVRTALTRYFSLPVVPTVLGFDPRLQFVHEHDGLDALRRATIGDFPGTFNVAGDGVLTLSQAIRRTGQPVRAAPFARRSLGRAGAAPARRRRLHARADPLPDLRPGRRHSADEGRSGLVPRYTTPGRSRTSSPVRGCTVRCRATTSMPWSSVW